MKKLLVLLIGCLFIIVNLSAQSQKRLVAHPGGVELTDSSTADTTHAPILLPKGGTIIETNPRSADGSLALYWWDNTGRAMVTISAAELNDFSSNAQLREWLEVTLGIKKYQKGYSRDGSNNIIDIRYWIVTPYDTSMVYHDTIEYTGVYVDTTYTKY